MSASSRYCTFVQPQHPLVRKIFSTVPDRREQALAGALEDLRRCCVYEPNPGRLDFDELCRRWEAGDGPLEVNCINSVCLLVSQLRASGFTADEVFAVLGSLRRFSFHHAWTLLRTDSGLVWVDPVDLVPRKANGAGLWHDYVFFVIFNDRHMYFLDDDKRRLLEGAV